MAKYFTFQEMIASDTAKQKHINNVPVQPETIDNIIYLMDNLDALREAWAAPIRVSSGYRCEKLNKAVGGVSDSQHVKGEAADIIPANGDLDKFKAFCREHFKHYDFDQCINEPGWIHISFSKNKQNRKQFLITKDKKTYSYWKQ